MTHVLTNPGYPNDLRFRSKSAEVYREHERRKEGILKTEFDKIRSLSRRSWQRTWEDPGEPLPSVKCNHFVTTYSTTHNYRALRELTPCRPTSPTRRNNPHPTRFVYLLLIEVFISITETVLAYVCKWSVIRNICSLHVFLTTHQNTCTFGFDFI